MGLDKMIYDLIIIGGGISGLLSYLEAKKNGFDKIVILEQKSRLGGRIDTITTKSPYSTWLDLGAARFSSTQTRMMSLLKELGLESHIHSLPPTPIDNLSQQKWKEINNKLGSAPNKTPAQIVGNSKWIESTGYPEDFHISSASAFLTEWSHYQPNAFDDWYELDGGLSQIIEKLSKKIPKKAVHLETFVMEVRQTNDIWEVQTIDKTYSANTIVMAIQPSTIKSLLPTIKLPKFHTQPLARIFVRAKSPPSWLEEHPITYRSNGSQCLSLGNRTTTTGWFELYYMSGSMATQYYQEYQKNQSKAIRQYEKEWKELTDTTIEIKDVEFAYWANGVEWYKPQPETLKDTLSQINNSQNIFYVGDSFSLSPGWIDGAIESVKSLPWKSIQKGGASTYTMEEVSKHNKKTDAWIVIRKKVYDITKWIPIHPGGSIIMEGVGKDATQLFQRVHPDLSVPRKILPRYFIGKLQK